VVGEKVSGRKILRHRNVLHHPQY